MRKPIEHGDPLTERQSVVFDFVRFSIFQGVPPTLKEIAEQCYPKMKIISARGAARLCLQYIERKGYLVVGHNETRGITLTSRGRDL